MFNHSCTNIGATGAALAAALMLASAAAPAQTTAMSPTVSFEQIAKQALATHPAILSRRSSSTAARADLDAAEWQRYPTPSLEANYDHNGVTTTSLRVQQPLWAGGRIDAGIDAANFHLQASNTAIDETKQDILYRVISAYVEAVRQQAREETLAQGVQQHERLLGLITRRVEHEASPRVDQELAQSRLYQANNDLSQVTQALANALTQLSQLAGMPVRRVGSLEADNLPGQQSRESMLARALAWSPTLHRLKHEEEAAQADIESKRASYKPQVSLRFDNSHVSAALNGVPAFSSSRLMLVVEAQTGAGLSALANVDAAIARRDAAREQRETAVRDVQERLTMDWDELQAARMRLENAMLASKSSKEVYESYERQYTAGRKTWLDVLNTVRESTQADVAVTDASAQASAALLRLKLDTGTLKGLAE